jgi:amidase
MAHSLPHDPHPSSADLAFLSINELRDRLDAGELSSRHLVQTLIARIAALDVGTSEVALRSIAAVADDAVEVATERDAESVLGRIRGLLHGIPVVIKDNIEAEGLPGCAGSTSLVGRPTREAPLVARLREAGAIVMASTNLSEWANMRSPHSTSGWSATGGLVGNPWALDRSAGGSSSGSGAAVAAGLSPLAVGTETDGSIVCPASLNGVVGLKATIDAIPRDFIVPISASQDAPGPMGRTVNDVALLFSVLSDQPMVNFRDKEVRFGVATSWRTGHTETDALFDQFLPRLQAANEVVVSVTPANAGDQEHQDEFEVLLDELHDDMTSYLTQRPGAGVASLADVVAYELENAATEMPYFGHEFFEMSLARGGRSNDTYRATRDRSLAWAIETCLEPALEGLDVLIAPSYAPAWKSDLALSGHQSAKSSGVTMAAAIAGWPIANVPLGLVDGLPVGIAIVGRANSDWLVLAAAHKIEAVVNAWQPIGHARFRPPQRG